MIQAIFYARFFPRKGPKIVAQSPPGCIVPQTPSAPTTTPPTNLSSSGPAPAPAPATTRPALFDFDVVRSYIIPRQPFCNRLVTVNDPDDKFSIVGFPVLIPDERYRRNEFMFNFGLVVDSETADLAPYERVVRRLAATFAEMEKQSGYLSAQDKGGDDGDDDDGEEGSGGNGGGKGMDVWRRGSNAVASAGVGVNDDEDKIKTPWGDGIGSRRPIDHLLEIIREDLNNYGECMIPVDEANTINMKLFPRHAPPPEVKGWHVPVAKMKLADIVDPTWDLTVQKIVSHIDGVSDVRRIAWQADVSLDLARTALRHLLYYDTILLLDMFFFSSCYAPRPGIHDFVRNVDGIVDECAAYVCIQSGREKGGGGPGSGAPAGVNMMDFATGSTRPHHYLSHLDPHDEDPHRVHPHSHSSSTSHVHPHPHSPPTSSQSSPSRTISNFQLIKLMTSFCHGKSVLEWLRVHQDNGLDVLRLLDVRRLVQFGVVKGCLYRVHKHVVSKQYLAGLVTGQALVDGGGDALQKYMDGCHSFDQIITEQNLTDGEIVRRLKDMGLPEGDWKVLYR